MPASTKTRSLRKPLCSQAPVKANHLRVVVVVSVVVVPVRVVDVIVPVVVLRVVVVAVVDVIVVVVTEVDVLVDVISNNATLRVAQTPFEHSIHQSSKYGGVWPLSQLIRAM
mmetsp:Transcript_84772/g.237374  ORF Transcript_84772/g.237374 Transcript_84772/m.237374 type:complete len:112 (+) Transcript_84772:1114-1449(+)